MEEKVINSQNSIRVKNKSNLPIRRTASVSELKSETYIKTIKIRTDLLSIKRKANTSYKNQSLNISLNTKKDNLTEILNKKDIEVRKDNINKNLKSLRIINHIDQSNDQTNDIKKFVNKALLLRRRREAYELNQKKIEKNKKENKSFAFVNDRKDTQVPKIDIENNINEENKGRIRKIGKIVLKGRPDYIKNGLREKQEQKQERRQGPSEKSSSESISYKEVAISKIKKLGNKHIKEETDKEGKEEQTDTLKRHKSHLERLFEIHKRKTQSKIPYAAAAMLLPAVCFIAIFLVAVATIAMNPFYINKEGKGIDDAKDSIAVQMATRMNKVNDDYWESIELAIKDRKQFKGIGNYHDVDIPSYQKVAITFYDSQGNVIDSDTPINNEAILSLASVYQMETDTKAQMLDFQDYCTFLWIASHEFTLEEEDPYTCDIDYVVETGSTSAPSIPSEYTLFNEIGNTDELPEKIWCNHGHFEITDIFEHEDSDGDIHYTYEWSWICDGHINAKMDCRVSDLNVPADENDTEFDEAKKDESIFDIDFIGNNLTNDIIDEYTINNKFNVDAWINDFKPQNYDLVVGWLNSQGNNIHDLKDFILSKVNGQKSSSVSDNSSDTTILSKAKSSFNQLFQLTAYADPNGYGSSESKGRYEWNGWDEGMRELASIRKREGYSDKYINKYNDLLKNKLKIPVSIADYNRIIDLMLNYKKTGQLTVVQELIMKTAAKSIGNIPYYFGGGHPGGGAGERSRVEAEGDKGSFIDANAPDPAMKIPAETFGMTVGTDWFGRTKRGLDCSAYV